MYLKSTFFNKIQLSNKLKKEIVRYAISFFFAWLVSALISDFSFFKSIIQATKIDELLTHLLVSSTESLLNFFDFSTYSNGNFLQINGSPGVRFIYGCLGIRQLVFFIVFIILQFGSLKHKLWYIPMGVLILALLNTLRSVIVVWGQYNNTNQAQLIHDIVSPIIMYPAILFLWLFWLNTFGKANINIEKPNEGSEPS